MEHLFFFKETSVLPLSVYNSCPPFCLLCACSCGFQILRAELNLIDEITVSSPVIMFIIKLLALLFSSSCELNLQIMCSCLSLELPEAQC